MTCPNKLTHGTISGDSPDWIGCSPTTAAGELCCCCLENFNFFLSFTTSRLCFCWIPLTITEKQQQKRKIREVEVSLWGTKLGSGGGVRGTRDKGQKIGRRTGARRGASTHLEHCWGTFEQSAKPPQMLKIVSCDELARPGLEHWLCLCVAGIGASTLPVTLKGNCGQEKQRL